MTESYYDKLAPYYRFIYPDWETSVRQQAAALDGVIREFFGDGVRHILDAACGIGTQSIGLAELGYEVTASDICRAEVEQARMETARRALSISFQVADMRFLWSTYQKQFDMVIACDNAVPHLLNDTEILAAFAEFYRCTQTGGGCLISAHNYENIKRSGIKVYQRSPHEIPGGYMVVFDIWRFVGHHHEITTYVLQDRGESTAPTAVIRGGTCYCIPVRRLASLLEESGFTQVEILSDRFFQPLVLGTKVA